LGKKPNLTHWGTEKEGNEGVLHTEINGKIVKKKIPTLQGNYYDLFDQLYHSITNNQFEPVTAHDGVNVMTIIEAAIRSNESKKMVFIYK
jgi:predicted dehydrogenase